MSISQVAKLVNRPTKPCSPTAKSPTFGPFRLATCCQLATLSRMAEPKSLADRAWYACHCLPRKGGRLPTRDSLEERHKLPQGVLSKIMKGKRNSLREPTLKRVAAALGAKPEWLGQGRGPVPVAEHLVPARPRNEREMEAAESFTIRSFQELAAGGVGPGAQVSTLEDMPPNSETLGIRRAGDEPTWPAAELRARELAPELPGWTFVAARAFHAPAHPNPVYPQYVVELSKLVHQSASIADQVAAARQDAREIWKKMISWHDDAKRAEDAWARIYQRSRPKSGEYPVDHRAKSSVPPAPRPFKPSSK